jgi:hypothetical protein
VGLHRLQPFFHRLGKKPIGFTCSGVKSQNSMDILRKTRYLGVAVFDFFEFVIHGCEVCRCS